MTPKEESNYLILTGTKEIVCHENNGKKGEICYEKIK